MSDPSTSARADRMPRSGARVLLVVGVGTLVGAASGSAYNLALPTLAAELDLSLDWAGGTVTAFLLTSTVFLLPAGRVGDLLGHRRLYLAGFVVMAVTSVVCGLADRLVVLLAARAVQGIGGAMVMAAGPALLTAAVPGRQRGRALGLLGTATYTGLTFGPLLGGWVVDALSWRWLFLLYAPLALGIAVAGFPFLPSARGGDGRTGFDWGGAVALVVGLPLLLFAGTQGNALGWGSPAVVAAVVCGAAALALFVLVEARAAAPMLDLALFRSRVFSGAVASAVTSYVAQFAVVILVPFYLIEALGLPPARAGLLLASQAAVMAVVTAPAGRLSDRVGSRGLATAGLLTMAASLGGMTRLGAHTSVVEVALWLALCGLGAGVFVSPNSSALMGSAPAAQQGVAAAVMAVSRTLGMIVGVAAATAVFAAAGGRTGGAWQADEYRALHVALAVAAAVAVAGALAASLRGRARETSSGT